MNKKGGLARLVELYGMLERLKEIEVKAASDAVVQIEHAAARIAEEECAATIDARTGLASGTRVESLAVDWTATAAKSRKGKMKRFESERKTAHAEAIDAHLLSKMASLQIGVMWSRALHIHQELLERREQDRSDDRFLSRRLREQTELKRDEG